MPSIETNRKNFEAAKERGDIVSVIRSAAVPLPIPVPPPVALNPYLRTTLPAVHVQQPDMQRQWQTGAVPQTRIIPLAAISNPNIGAMAASQATIVVANSGGGGSGSGGISSVALTAPPEFAVSGSPGAPPSVNLGLSWVAETPGYVFSGPLPNLTGFQGTASGADSNPPPPTTVTMTPQTSTSLGLIIFNDAIATPSGWSQVNGGSNNLCSQVITGTSPVSATLTGGNIHIVDMALFTGPAPSLIQSQRTGVGPFPGPASLAFTSGNTGGNTLVVAFSVYLGAGSTDPIAITVSDTNKNQYQQIINHAQTLYIGSGFNRNFLNAVFVVAGCANGSNTVNFSVDAGTATISGTLIIAEFGPLPTGAGIPSFKPFSGAQIPPTNLATEGQGGVGNILPVTHGGTGVSTSTGTGSAVLSANPTLTGTATLAAEALTGKITKYNNISTVANGVPAEYATVDLTGQTAAIATTTLYAISAIGAGQYRLSWNAKVTTVAGVSSTLGPLTITYTDPDGVVQTINAAAQSNAGVIETSDTGNVTTTVLLGVPMMLNCAASTNIQYAFAYTSNAANVMAYNLHLKLEAL